MGFFAQFFSWLNTQLASYVSAKTAMVASAIEPAAVTLGTIYVMMWGFLSLTGRIQEPIWEGIKRILVVAIVLGMGIRLWTYNQLVVDTFARAPDQLAAAIIGAPDVVSVIDKVWLDGTATAEQLLTKGSILDSDFAYYIAGFLVFLLVGLAVAVTAFLIALSKVATALILALGPIFIVLLFFDSTKRFFEAWVAQLANYALIGVLALLAASLLLSVLRAYAQNAAALGTGITIADSTRVCMASVLTFLVMRQVMPIAAGLASGVALSSYGVISGAVRWGMGSARRSGYEISRGVMDGIRREPISKWDSFRRMAGNKIGRGLSGGFQGTSRGGTVVRRERVMPSTTSRR